MPGRSRYIGGLPGTLDNAIALVVGGECASGVLRLMIDLSAAGSRDSIVWPVMASARVVCSPDAGKERYRSAAKPEARNAQRPDIGTLNRGVAGIGVGEPVADFVSDGTDFSR